MSAFVYYAVFETPHSSVDDPETIVRRRRGAARTTAEALSEDGGWHPSDVLDDVFLGERLDDAQEISPERARAVVEGWRSDGLVPFLPDDLRSVG